LKILFLNDFGHLSFLDLQKSIFNYAVVAASLSACITGGRKCNSCFINIYKENNMHGSHGSILFVFNINFIRYSIGKYKK
jgi:hypothetical protein